MSRSNYLYDKFIDQPDKSPQDVQSEKINKFINDYVSHLRGVEDALDENLGEVWDSVEDPIKLDFEPHENLRFDQLIKTNNHVLFKVLLVLSHLHQEMTELKQIAAEKFYPTLAIFGENADVEAHDGQIQLQFGRTIPFLMDLWNFCERINIVVKHTIQQLAALYASTQKKKQASQSSASLLPERKALSVYKKVHFLAVFSALADLLGVLITIEEIIFQNTSIPTFVTWYKRMLGKVLEQPEDFGVDAKTAGRLQYLLQKIEGDIFDRLILETCITRSFEDEMNGIEVVTNKDFKEEFESNMKTYFYYLTVNLGSPSETDKRQQFVGFCGLYMLYFNLWRDPSDKKLFRAIWDVQKKLPVIQLYGNTIWNSSEFFDRLLPDMVKLIGVRNPKRDIDENRKAVLKQLDDSLAKDVDSMYMHLCVWMARIESTFTVETAGKDVVGIEGTLILQGLHLAYQISNHLKTVLNLHLIVDKPLTVSQVILLCRCIEMVKTIQNTYHRRSAIIGHLISLISEYLAYKIQRLLLPLKNKLEIKKVPSDTEIDQLSSVTLSLELLNGPPSRKRLLLVRMALAVALQKTSGLMRESEFEEVRSLLRKIELMSNFESLLTAGCDCTFLYWSRELVHTVFQHVYRYPERAQELVYIFAAVHDPSKMLLSAVHLENANTLLESYKNEILESFQSDLIDPLCQEIETDLRLHIHTAVLGQHTTTLQSTIKDLSVFFKIRPIVFFGKRIDIKRRVEHYLDTTFYNLTTIAMHDWKTYEEMRNLAFEKYDLELTNVYLPGQTVEQGLDVLEITRNIHVFVAKYSYNLNNNMFVERCSATDAKNLNSIHIRHVANSIRTHGTGIMNTTVNFVYQFLGRKFFIFSQFIYDDHIKSRLIKDIRFYKENQVQLENMYPLKRAEKFAKDIRKLGTVEGGLTYLDQFRGLLTDIGNALGYVRMVRAGGLRYISDAIKFVPDLESIPNFEELVSSDGLSTETVSAAKNLDAVLTNLSQKFAEGSDYFKILEQVFTQEMQKDQNSHLRNFYAIVPPLTLSFVEYMIISKDKMLKKGKEANFTDDGFALGVAFILKILNQNRSFDSLHWFESVDQYYTEEYKQLLATMGDKRKKAKDEDEMQTMKLTLNRVESYKREFELLFWSFSGSRVFFRD